MVFSSFGDDVTGGWTIYRPGHLWTGSDGEEGAIGEGLGTSGGMKNQRNYVEVRRNFVEDNPGPLAESRKVRGNLHKGCWVATWVWHKEYG